MNMKHLFLSGLVFLTSGASWALQVDQYSADRLCSYPFSCNSETQDPDNRSPQPIQQPSASAAQGACSTLPASQSYRAAIGRLECGATNTIHQRDRFPYDQEKLDENYEYLMAGNRNAAQKAMLVDMKWSDQQKFAVRENWTYMRKVGDYINCAGRDGAQGGESESYMTTCYRRNRMERVKRRVITVTTYCAKANPPPQNNDDSGSYGSSGSSSSSRSSGSGSSSGSYGGSSYGSGSGSSSRSSGGGGSSSSTRKAPKGNGEDRKSIKKSTDRGWSDYEYIKTITDTRLPADAIRWLPDRTDNRQEDAPAYGCARWATRNSEDVEELNIPAEDLQYSCQKVRNKWCTWYEAQSASQMCPDTKTATVNVTYVTPNDWNPSNPKYDDQLPNKFDLLLGESEIVRISANTSTSTVMMPNMEFKNALPSRKDPWNRYEFRANPAQLNCEYKDQVINIDVNTVGRNVQAAPNPLVLPTDENGKAMPLSGEDKEGRPAILSLLNPGRSQVLDRSNISRVFGADAKADNMATSATAAQDTKAKTGGISKKFWENTRFWIRLKWKDGNKDVKVTRFRQFDINKARPVGDNLTISLTGQYGMDNFYQLAVPFETVFGFLGGDVALDPNKEYLLEIKVAQPGFDGIYLSGLKNDPTVSDEDKKVSDDSAYSESMLIPLKAVSDKRSLWQKFLNWRSNHTLRP